MNDPLNDEQKKQLKAAETEFAGEIGKIRRQQAEIIKEYEEKKTRYKEGKVREMIKGL